MKKSEIVGNIIIILNWGQENKEYKSKIVTKGNKKELTKLPKVSIM